MIRQHRFSQAERRRSFSMYTSASRCVQLAQRAPPDLSTCGEEQKKYAPPKGESRRTSANLGEPRRVSGESRLASTALHPRQRTDTVTMPISPPVVGITCSQPEV